MLVLNRVFVVIVATFVQYRTLPGVSYALFLATHVPNLKSMVLKKLSV